MKLTRWINKNKDILIAIGIVMIIYGFIFLGLYKNSGGDFKDVSGYTMWNGFFNSRYGQWNIILSSLVIMLGCTYTFHKKLSSGYFKNEVTREPYHKYIRKNILRCYKKALFIYPAIFLGLFLVLCLFFGWNYDPSKFESSYLLFFPDLVSMSPLGFIFAEAISVYFFSIFVINVILIVMRYIKKFSLAMILSFLLLNVYNVLFGYTNIGTVETGPFNIYDAFFMTRESLLPLVVLGMGISILLSSIILFLVYREKEKTILSVE